EEFGCPANVLARSDLVVREVEIVHYIRPSRRHREAHGDPNRRCLSGSVESDQPQKLTVSNLQVDILDSGQGASRESLSDVPKRDHIGQPASFSISICECQNCALT